MGQWRRQEGDRARSGDRKEAGEKMTGQDRTAQDSTAQVRLVTRNHHHHLGNPASLKVFVKAPEAMASSMSCLISSGVVLTAVTV